MAEEGGKPPSGTTEIFTSEQITGPSKLTSLTGEMADSAQRLADSIQNVNREAKPTEKAYDNFARGADDAAKAHDRLTDILKQEGRALVEEARQIGSWQSQLRSSSSALTSYLGDLKRVISIQNIYKRHLDELRKGQDTYLSSLNFSSKSHQGLQKYIDATNKGYLDAGNVMKTYRVDLKKVHESVDILNQRFGTQMGAMGKNTEAMLKLQHTLMGFSRSTGTELAASADFMKSRLDHTTMTIDEVEAETRMMVRTGDEFTIAIQKLGPEARATGNMLRKDLIQVVKETQGLFKVGMLEGAKFHKATAALAAEMKKSGIYTPAEIEATQKSVGKIMAKMSDPNDMHIAYRRVIQAIATGSVQVSDKYKKRIMEAQRSAGGGLTAISENAMAGAARGNLKVQLLALKGLKELYEKDRRKFLLDMQQLSGEDQGAFMLAKMFDNIEVLEKAIQTTDTNAKKRSDEAKGFWNKFEDAMKQGASPKDPRYKIALATYEETAALRNQLQYSQKAILIALMAQAGVQGAGALLNKFTGRAADIANARSLVRGSRGARTLQQTTTAARTGTSRLAGTQVAGRAARLPAPALSSSAARAEFALSKQATKSVLTRGAGQAAKKGAGVFLRRAGIATARVAGKVATRAVPIVGWALLAVDVAIEAYNLITKGGQNAIQNARGAINIMNWMGAISDERNAYLQGYAEDNFGHIKTAADLVENLMSRATGLSVPDRVKVRSITELQAQTRAWEQARDYIDKTEKSHKKLTDMEKAKLAQAKQIYKKLKYRAEKMRQGEREQRAASRQMRRDWLIESMQKIIPKLASGELDVKSEEGLKAIAKQLIGAAPALGHYKYSIHALSQVLRGEGGGPLATARLLPLISILKERGIDITKLEKFAGSEIQRLSLKEGGWRYNIMQRKLKGVVPGIEDLGDSTEEMAYFWFKHRDKFGGEYERVNQDVRREMSDWAKSQLLEVNIYDDMEPTIQRLKVDSNGVATLETGGTATFSVRPIVTKIGKDAGVKPTPTTGTP